MCWAVSKAILGHMWHPQHRLAMPPSENMLTVVTVASYLVHTMWGCLHCFIDGGCETDDLGGPFIAWSKWPGFFLDVNWEALAWERTLNSQGLETLGFRACAMWWEDVVILLLFSTPEYSPMWLFGPGECSSLLTSVLQYVKSVVLNLWAMTPW